MRKFLATAGLVVVCLTAVSAPAFAQRDPFDPVIDPNAATTTTSTAETGTDNTVFEPGVPGSIGSERIADTGADVSPYLAVAFTLVSLGGLAIAWARLHQSHPHRA